MPVTPGGTPASPSGDPRPSPRADDRNRSTTLRPMLPWRIVGGVAIAIMFALMGQQVHRLIEDKPWSASLMWASVAAGVAWVLCVLVWTWTTTDNARRLVWPADRVRIPDPNAAVRTWIVPFTLVAIAVAMVTLVGENAESGSEQPVPMVPLGIGIVALLLAIPMTYRPLNYLAGVLRQVGGSSVRVVRWMWVPVVTAVGGIASIVALRYAGAEDTTDPAADAAGVPLWIVAVVAIGPCLVTVLLTWRAVASVEDAITLAAARRGQAAAPVKTKTRRSSVQPLVNRSERTKRIDLLPGAELLRFLIVTLIAGLALLSVVGAVLSALLWMESRDTGVAPAERQRLWDALDVLSATFGAVTLALLAAASVWTFVTVMNVRMVSGRRRNPLIAALSWPAAAAGIWRLADGLADDASIGRSLLTYAAQAAVLVVPFLLLERSAEAVGARRTPLRVVYALTVLLLVQVQVLGGLAELPDSITTTDIGRLAAELAIGALILLCSTLAVTEACSALSRTSRHEADHHNMLVDQRAALGERLQPAAG